MRRATGRRPSRPRTPPSGRRTPAWTSTSSTRRWGDYKTKFEATLGAGNAPDVIEFGNTDTPKYMAAGALAPLNKSDFPNSGTWLSGLAKSATYNGKTYGVPYYAGARGVIYRTDQYKAARDHGDAEVARRVHGGGQQADARSTARTRRTRPCTFRAATGTPRCRSSTTSAARSRGRRTASGSAPSTRRRSLAGPRRVA